MDLGLTPLPDALILTWLYLQKHCLQIGHLHWHQGLGIEPVFWGHIIQPQQGWSVRMSETYFQLFQEKKIIATEGVRKEKN